MDGRIVQQMFAFDERSTIPQHRRYQTELAKRDETFRLQGGLNNAVGLTGTMLKLRSLSDDGKDRDEDSVTNKGMLWRMFPAIDCEDHIP